MRIDPHTRLFHDLTADEAQNLLLVGEDLQLRGKQPAFDDPILQEWLRIQGIKEGTENYRFQAAGVIVGDLPAIIFYSLLLLQREADEHENDSPSTARRLRDGAHALSLPMPPPDAAFIMLEAYLNEVGDGVRALQSLDELGPERDAKALKDHDELLRRYMDVSGRLGARRLAHRAIDRAMPVPTYGKYFREIIQAGGYSFGPDGVAPTFVPVSDYLESLFPHPKRGEKLEVVDTYIGELSKTLAVADDELATMTKDKASRVEPGLTTLRERLQSAKEIVEAVR